jgi:prepilin-type N-terminal cleavage/methylation domain-containing protein
MIKLLGALKNRGKNESGFTLIEVLVVVVIIGILVAIAIPALLGAQRAAINATVKSDVRNTQANVILALNDNPTASGFVELQPEDVGVPAAVTIATPNVLPMADVPIPDGQVGVQVVESAQNTVAITGDYSNYEIIGCSPITGFGWKYLVATGLFEETDVCDGASGGGGSGGGGPTNTFTSLMWSHIDTTPAGVEFQLISASSDFSVIAATPYYGDKVYVSTDSGVTWSSHVVLGMDLNFNDIEVSRDGTTMVAVTAQQRGNPVISRDSGATWTALPFQTTAWGVGLIGINISEDNQRISIAQGGSDVRAWKSADNGQSWVSGTIATDHAYISDMDASVDGQTIYAYALSLGSGMYKSTDYGFTWVEVASPGQTSTSKLSGNADGSVMYLASNQLYAPYNKSVDGGSSWTQEHTELSGMMWSNIFSSDDGNKIVAALGGTLSANRTVMTSIDGGSTWTRNDGADGVPAVSFWDVTTTPDGGSILVTTSGTGGIWLGQYS